MSATGLRLGDRQEVVARVLDAHGGLRRWHQGTAVELRLSSGGLAFTAKGQPRALRDCRAKVATTGQQVELDGLSPHAWSAHFDGTGRYGSPGLAERLAALRRGRRRLRWNLDDVATFAAAALWTYVHVPFVLADPDVDVELLGWWEEAGERWLRLGVTFPDHMVTHCRRQVLYVDGEYRLRRHDYTASAFGRWARAAQYLTACRWFDGLLLATHRRVYPRLPGGRRARWPRLVSIDVHDAVVR